jgi:hypothetical protein
MYFVIYKGKYASTLKMGAACTAETSATFPTTRCNDSRVELTAIMNCSEIVISVI